MDYLNQYTWGWTKGDASVVVESLDDSYQLDDPHSGFITKTGFRDYLANLKAQVDTIRGSYEQPFMEISEVVTQEEGGVLTAWAWWSIPGISIQGSGLIK